MFCGNCGKELPDKAEYCSECGFRIASKVICTAGKQEETDISKKNYKVKKDIPLGGKTIGDEIRESSFRRKIGNYLKYAGVVAGILAFISLFMDWMKLSLYCLLKRWIVQDPFTNIHLVLYCIFLRQL